jgi:hypothetical protein
MGAVRGEDSERIFLPHKSREENSERVRGDSKRQDLLYEEAISYAIRDAISNANRSWHEIAYIS